MLQVLIKIIVVSLILFNVGCKKTEGADIIIIAPVYTMNDQQPWADAVAIKSNKIIYVGDQITARSLYNNSTHIIEKPDGMVLPGFIDTHVHLLSGGIEMLDCQLFNLENPEQIFIAIKEFAQNNLNDEWIRGGGWSLPIFPEGNPQKEWLDEIIPDRPVYLFSADGHSAWVNSKALELAGIDEFTPDPLNGRIERKLNSNIPSGVLREDAMKMVEKFLPLYTIDQIQNGLKESVKEANKFGITSILDAGTGSIKANDINLGVYDALDAYKEATESGEITIRVTASKYVNPDSWEHDLKNIKGERFINDFGKMNTVKFFADGVIEGKTAALIEPYLGSNDKGIINWDPDTLKKVLAIFDKEGFQIHVHAIGDRAIRNTLDAFEFAKNENNITEKRHMMSHVQLINPLDIPRFYDLGVIPSFQALWACPDKYIVDLTFPVLGPDRSRWNYPIQTVVLTGARIAGGSDWTVSSLNPLDAIEVAVTRKELGLKDGPALFPQEAVSLKTILKAYTIWGAYSLSQEQSLGSIENGKLADIIILNKNLFEVPPFTIHEVKVSQTIFNGEIVYHLEE